jgi:hypothetical protein
MMLSSRWTAPGSVPRRRLNYSVQRLTEDLAQLPTWPKWRQRWSNGRLWSHELSATSDQDPTQGRWPSGWSMGSCPTRSRPWQPRGCLRTTLSVAMTGGYKCQLTMLPAHSHQGNSQNTSQCRSSSKKLVSLCTMLLW